MKNIEELKLEDEKKLRETIKECIVLLFQTFFLFSIMLLLFLYLI